MEKTKISVVHLEIVKEREIPWEEKQILGPGDAKELGYSVFKKFNKECMIAACLNGRNEPVSFEVIALGGSSECQISIPEVFKTALLSNSRAIILYHNHPTGNPSPSMADRRFTKRILKCGKFLGIDIHDHIILGDEGNYYSFLEEEKELWKEDVVL